jgi:hypothetical protein
MKTFKDFVETDDRMKQFVANSKSRIANSLETIAFLYAVIDDPQVAEEFKEAVMKTIVIIEKSLNWDFKGIYRYLDEKMWHGMRGVA